MNLVFKEKLSSSLLESSPLESNSVASEKGLFQPWATLIVAGFLRCCAIWREEGAGETADTRRLRHENSIGQMILNYRREGGVAASAYSRTEPECPVIQNSMFYK